MARLAQICRCCVADGVPRRSFVVALIVGTVLNLINQGDALLSGQHLNLVKLLLTYVVPYGVATYGAVSFRLTAMKADTFRPESSVTGSDNTSFHRQRNASQPGPDDSTGKYGP
ncbi:nitrate/nitrite transporter NrtS [Salinisphaera hydrothermalis]|uniref:nitrate/nitrite transporter NrtS n=1 Tax=Salinisphaera TaxID=180541 RepID=UPI003341E3F5